MTDEEFLRQKKLEKYAYENKLFSRFVTGLKEKPFDLSGTKEDVANQFFERVLSNQESNLSCLEKSILKSYYKAGREVEILDYLDLGALKVKKSVGMINHFLNEYISNTTVACQNSRELNQAVADIVADRLQEVYGDTIYWESANVHNKESNNTRKNIFDALAKLGYDVKTKEGKFLVKEPENNKIEVKEEHQEKILKTYESIVNEYIKHLAKYVGKEITAEQFTELYGVVYQTLNNLENKMTEETKNKKSFLDSKETFVEFYENDIEKTFKMFTREGKQGLYYKEVNTALTNIIKEVGTESDKNIVKQFYHKLQVLNEALSIKDEKGKNYPANYFVCMPIHPTTFMHIITKFQKMEGVKPEHLKLISDTKGLVRASFDIKDNTSDALDVAKVLKTFRMKYTFDGKTVDLVDDNNFENYVKTVKGVMSKHTLPRNELCIGAVGMDIIKGRQPITYTREMAKRREQELSKDGKNF